MIASCRDGIPDQAIAGIEGGGSMRSTQRTKIRAQKRPPLKQRTDFQATGLNARTVRLLRASFALIEPKTAIAGLVFYRQLFTLDPSLKGLFNTSIELQGRKLMEALSYTVTTLEKPGMLVPMLESLGRRHVTYGVRDEHYETVIKAPLQTLELVLGDGFNPQTHRAWNQAFKFVAATMKRGASAVPARRDLS